MDIVKELYSLQDLKYRDFHSKLIPNINKELLIGVRVPLLRALAKNIIKTNEQLCFLQQLPHKFYEENCLHAYIIGELNDFNQVVELTNKFLPYIDNWATCDTFSPKAFKHNSNKLLPHIRTWIESSHVYTTRFAVCCLMRYFLGDNYQQEYSDMVQNIKLNDYYIKMVVAWYFATALVKQYNNVIHYLTEHKLDVWTHNQTIKKANESFQTPPAIKTYLKSLKR